MVTNTLRIQLKYTGVKFGTGVKLTFDNPIDSTWFRVEHLGAPARVKYRRLTDHSISLTWKDEPLRHGESITIYLSTQSSEAPTQRFRTKWSESSAGLPRTAGSATDSGEAGPTKSSRADIRRFKTAHVPECRLPVSYHVKGSSTIEIAQRAFFYELELNCSPKRISMAEIHWKERAARVRAVRDITNLLIRRVATRVLRQTLPTASRYETSCLRHLADCVHQVFRRHFQTDIIDENGSQYESIMESFIAFAARQLLVSGSIHGVNCEPNGDNFFLFAEFALACLDSRVANTQDKDFWNKFLLSVLPALKVYVNTFVKPGSTTFDSLRTGAYSTANTDTTELIKYRVRMIRALRNNEFDIGQSDYTALIQDTFTGVNGMDQVSGTANLTVGSHPTARKLLTDDQEQSMS